MTSTGYKVCGSPLGEEGPRSSCCCSVGSAWGPDCEKCPEPGTAEFDLVCPGGIGFQPNPKTVILEDINECNELNQVKTSSMAFIIFLSENYFTNLISDIIIFSKRSNLILSKVYRTDFEF